MAQLPIDYTPKIKIAPKKLMVGRQNVLLKWSLFRGHVSSREGIPIVFGAKLSLQIKKTPADDPASAKLVLKCSGTFFPTIQIISEKSSSTPSFSVKTQKTELLLPQQILERSDFNIKLKTKNDFTNKKTYFIASPHQSLTHRLCLKIFRFSVSTVPTTPSLHLLTLN